MKNILSSRLALFFGAVLFFASLSVQSCTQVEAQETLIPAKSEISLVPNATKDTLSATNVFIGKIQEGEDLSLPIKLKQIQPDSTVSLNVVFTQPVKGQSFWAWSAINIVGWLTVGLFVVQIIVNITPTQADNNVFNILKLIVDSIFRSKNASGGYF